MSVPKLFSPKQLLCLLLFIHVLRSVSLLAPSQFWAEDAVVFYAEAYEKGFGALVIPYAGYLHTIQRIVAACTVHFPLAYAPSIFNVVAFLVQFLPVLLILSPRTDRLFAAPQDKYVFAFLYLVCPINLDTYICLTNIQWYLPVWMLFYLLADKAASPMGRWLEYLLLLLGCLTGPFALFLLPIYLFFVYRKETRFDPLHLVFLLLGSITQFLVILNSLNSPPASHNFRLLAEIFSVKIFWNSLFGAQGQQYFFKDISIYKNALFLYSGFALWLLIIFLALKTRNVALVAFTCFATFVAASGFYKGLPEIEQWGHSPTQAGRYANNAVLALLYAYYVLYQQGRQRQGKGHLLFGLFFGVGLFVAVPFDFRITRMVDLQWQEEVARYESAKPGEKVTLPVNPPGWNLTIIKRGK